MVIEALKHRYYVIHKEEGTPKYEIFCCREYVDAQHKAYDVYCVKEPLLIQALLLELTDREGDFTDLYECFSRDGKLYVVFLHKEGLPLEEKLKEEMCSLKERMQIGKNLLEQILLLSIPDYFLAKLWKEKQILVDEGLSVSFCYRLEGILLSKEEQNLQIRNGLSALFEELFQKEIELEKCPEISEFTKNLKEGKFHSIREVYQEYNGLCEILQNLSRRGNIRPNTLIFRIWDRMKKAIPYIKKAVGVVILIMLAGYLIYTILYPKATVECLKFETIGTLMIEEVADKE